MQNNRLTICEEKIQHEQVNRNLHLKIYIYVALSGEFKGTLTSQTLESHNVIMYLF